MSRLVDLTGQVFGNLTVLSRDPEKKATYWLCRCSCGVVKPILSPSLQKGLSKSCGCGKTKLTSKQTAFYRILHTYKTNAVDRNLCWELTEDDFSRLIQGDCHYCGTKPAKSKKPRKGSDCFIYNGIDRVNNTIGYTPENCVSCCTTCNYAKRKMTIEVFTAWINRVSAHRTTLSCHSPKAVGSPNPSSTHSEV